MITFISFCTKISIIFLIFLSVYLIELHLLLQVPQIRYATPERLLERLTDLRFLSIDFLNTFLLTYRVFTDGVTVLEALKKVFYNADPPEAQTSTAGSIMWVSFCILFCHYMLLYVMLCVNNTVVSYYALDIPELKVVKYK